MTVDEFKAQQDNSDGVIVDPNIQRSSIAEKAAKAGFHSMNKPSTDQRSVDLVKDLGYESVEEKRARYERENPDDITKALGVDLANKAESMVREMKEFGDALDLNGGEMTNEEYVMSTDTPDYLYMLNNPSSVPNPLNKDFSEFNKRQRDRFEEAKKQEESDKAMMGEDEEYIQDQITTAQVEKITPISSFQEETDDEDIISEMDDVDDIGLGGVDVDKYDYHKEDSYSMTTEMNEEIEKAIPVMESKDPSTTDTKDIMEDEEKSINDMVSKATPDDIDDTKLDDNPGQDLANKAMSFMTEDTSEMVDLDKELRELEENDSDDTEAEKIYKEKMENAKRDIKDKVIPIASKLDIRGFSISNKPVSLSGSIEMANTGKVVKSARWGLFSSKLPIDMKEFGGTEIDELVKITSGSDFSASDLMKRYKIFYDHILSPKPKTVEAWIKTISVMDVKHLYAAAYMSSFNDINFMPFDCTDEKCNNGFISDNIPFEKVVKYESADAKKEAIKLINSVPPVKAYELYKTEIIPISNTYAMSFKDPSIYDAQIAPLYLDNDWYNKMEGTIAISMYVDKIYVIDINNKTIRPLNIKEFHGDPRKTLKSKVLALAKVLNTLTSDQYNLISSYISEINKTSSNINYQMPEIYCPKCNTKIEARETTAANLLFTRHRLTSLANG